MFLFVTFNKIKENQSTKLVVKFFVDWETTVLVITVLTIFYWIQYLQKKLRNYTFLHLNVQQLSNIDSHNLWITSDE